MKTRILAILAFSIFTVTQMTAQSFTIRPSFLDSLKAHAAKAGYSGTMLFYKGNQLLLSWSAGLANQTTQAPNTIQTRFNIGSIGKTLTSVLIMQLVEQHILELDQPVRNYLPAGTLKKGSEQITIRQLLNHSSGLGDFFESPAYRSGITKTIDEHLALVNDLKPVTDTPGIRFEYSNAGYIVLGKLLEHHYQQPYQTIVSEKLLAPLGIQLQASAAYATGYYKEQQQWLKGDENDPAFWTSAGGLFLTVQELHQVVTAIIKGTYVSKKSLERLWQKELRQEQEPPFVYYGLGWMLEDPNCIRLRGHNGGTKGFQSAFRYLPDDDLYFYFLSNHDNGIQAVFMETIFSLMEQKGCKMEMPR